MPTKKVRQDGDLHIPAFMAAFKAYKKHEGKAARHKPTSSRVHRVAASLDPKKYWAGIRHERWIANR